MNIGEERRTIYIEPIDDPIPTQPDTEPLSQPPERDPVPAKEPEPAR